MMLRSRNESGNGVQERGEPSMSCVDHLGQRTRGGKEDLWGNDKREMMDIAGTTCIFGDIRYILAALLCQLQSAGNENQK